MKIDWDAIEEELRAWTKKNTKLGLCEHCGRCRREAPSSWDREDKIRKLVDAQLKNGEDGGKK